MGGSSYNTTWRKVGEATLGLSGSYCIIVSIRTIGRGWRSSVQLRQNDTVLAETYTTDEDEGKQVTINADVQAGDKFTLYARFENSDTQYHAEAYASFYINELIFSFQNY